VNVWSIAHDEVATAYAYRCNRLRFVIFYGTAPIRRYGYDGPVFHPMFGGPLVHVHDNAIGIQPHDAVVSVYPLLNDPYLLVAGVRVGSVMPHHFAVIPTPLGIIAMRGGTAVANFLHGIVVPG
jgi:hypothetical protein